MKIRFTMLELRSIYVNERGPSCLGYAAWPEFQYLFFQQIIPCAVSSSAKNFIACDFVGLSMSSIYPPPPPPPPTHTHTYTPRKKTF